MDELTNNEIEEYLQDLPSSILNLIQDKTWSKRVDEISAKYSLSEEQDIVLKNLVLFVFIGAEEETELRNSIKSELLISDLLTDQIINDLDERVFQYAFNKISEENNLIEKQPEEHQIQRKDENGLDNLRTMAGDIKSFKEPGESSYTENKVESSLLPTKDNEYIPAKKDDVFIPENLPGIEVYDSSMKDEFVLPKDEFVQKPADVSNYTLSSQEPKIEIVSKPKSIMGEKLNYTVTNQTEKPSINSQLESPNKYNIDPYREPVE